MKEKIARLLRAAVQQGRILTDEPMARHISFRAGGPADVFFMQYAVCILVLTALLVLRLCDQNAYTAVTDTFREQTSAPDLPWTQQLIALVGSLWK